MPPTLTRSLPPQTTSSPGRTAAGWVAAGVAALVVAALAGEVLEPPGTVDLVVRNERTEAVSVVVGGPGGGPELPIATIDAGEERSVEAVLDQGGRWAISFRIAGEVVGDLEVTGSALAAGGYEIVVPAGPAPEAAQG